MKQVTLLRDLKPDNLLVVALSTKANVNCKLSDFGTTRDINNAATQHYTTGVGTPIYMVPQLSRITIYPAGTRNS